MSTLRRTTDFVLQSPLQAMGVALVFSCLPWLGSIGILIAGLVTLRKGAQEGLYVLIAATLPYVAKYYAFPSGSELAFIGLMLTVVNNTLIWLFAIVLRRYGNWSVVLEYALLLGVVVIGVIHLLYPDVSSWWAHQMNQYLTQTSEMINGAGTPATDTQMQMIDFMKGYATGFIVISLLFNVLLQLVLARWWQAVVFNPGGLQKELHSIHLSHVVGFVFLIGIALSWLINNETVTDMAPLLYSIFCAAGLSLAHFYFNRKKKNVWVWLIILYLLLIWLFPLSIVLMAIIGFIDVWVDFRKKWVRPAV